MRIAIISEIFLPKRDGVTLLLSRLIAHLHSQGHEVLIVAPSYAPSSIHNCKIARAYGVPLGLYPGLRLNFFTPDLQFKLLDFAPDVIHFVDPVLLGVQVFCFVRLFMPKVACVVSLNTQIAHYTEVFGYARVAPIQTALFERQHDAATLSLVPSKSMSTELVAQGFDEEKFRLWPGGVDTTLFHPSKRSENLRRRWLANTAVGNGEKANVGDKTILLYVGRLSWEKNLELIRDTYLSLDHSKVHLVVVGDGPARKEVASLFRPDQITLTGWLSGTALASAYASADIFLFPSTSETFGLVVVEAMASGLPVVAMRSQGVRDIVREGKTGILVPVEDPTRDCVGFRDAVKILIRDEGKRRDMGRRAFEDAREWEWVWSWKAVQDAYQEAVDSHALSDNRLGDRLVEALVIYALFMWQNIMGFVLGMYSAATTGSIRATPTMR